MRIFHAPHQGCAATCPTLVQALPEKYYADKHLPGALNLPHDRVDALARKLLPNRNAEIVVYCANRQCQNSHIAAHRLSVLGYTDVAVYPGGKQDWDEAGLTFESATEPAAPVQITPATRNFPIAASA